MAITHTLDVPAQFEGSQKVVRGTLTFDSSYPTGGEAVTIASLGLARLDDLVITNPDDGYVFQWDRSKTSPKVLAYWTGTSGAVLDQITATTDLSAVIVRFCARGA